MSSDLDDLIAEANRLKAPAVGPVCVVCGEAIHRALDICGCGDATARFTLTMQQRLRYLDEEGQRLKVAAQRHFSGDRSPEANKELKSALRCWLDYMEGL